MEPIGRISYLTQSGRDTVESHAFGDDSNKDKLILFFPTLPSPERCGEEIPIRTGRLCLQNSLLQYSTT